MKPLDPPDSQHLNGAQGWLKLGNHIEANEELERITPLNRAHPDVLQVRWRIYAAAGTWDTCLDIATALTEMVPERRFGWLHRARSLDKLGRTAEAKDLLVLVLDTFEVNATFPYHLARFCCRLGQVDEARTGLQQAFEVAQETGALDRLKLRALDDPDLEPIWKPSSNA